jgi:hypothetical protein
MDLLGGGGCTPQHWPEGVQGGCIFHDKAKNIRDKMRNMMISELWTTITIQLVNQVDCGRRTWPTQLGTSRAGTNGWCVGCNAPQRKVKKGGPRMLELRNLLNIKEYSEKLRSKKVWKRKLFLGPRKEGGPNVLVKHLPLQTSYSTPPPPTRSCWTHPWGKFGGKYCVLFILKCYICPLLQERRSCTYIPSPLIPYYTF